jgi:hypothetical protein
LIYNIYKDGDYINRIESSEDFVTAYCEENGYTYELEEPTPTPDPAPTELDLLRSQIEEMDDTCIELYEANEAQQAVNEAQDEALIELYELIGG